jgi:hypothetical protein
VLEPGGEVEPLVGLGGPRGVERREPVHEDVGEPLAERAETLAGGGARFAPGDVLLRLGQRRQRACRAGLGEALLAVAGEPPYDEPLAA